MAKRKFEDDEDKSNRIKKFTKKSVHYGDVTVFYFQRVQSFCCIPSLAGVALGLSSRHIYSEQCKINDEFRTFEREPLPSKVRQKLLRLAGVKKWKKSELKIARDIRISRLNCGCSCGEYCFPQTCSCCLNGIGCQVDEGTFPCSCRPNCCLNAQGRLEYSGTKIARHRTETLARVQANMES
jgi:cysteine/serine-rich nuclear protein